MPQKDMPCPSTGEPHILLEMDMDRPQGKREEEICVCIYLIAYFTCFSCRWNETFQKEVVSSRLETTRMLARAITEAPQPRPQAWVLVTGVGMPQITNPLH